MAGTYNNVGTWTNPAPTPSGFSVILGGGTGGSDRIEITWGVNAIKNQWLEVDVKADANTGLSSPDIFYFGSAIGDSGEGNSATQITVNGTDVTEQHNNPSNALNVTPIWNPVDIDKSGVVNGSDATLISGNAGFVLHFIKNPTNPFAPARATRASARAWPPCRPVPARRPAAHPAWLVSRLESAGDLNSGEIADYFRQLAAEDSAADQETLLEADQAAEDLGLNDDLLDGLLADLGLV